VTSSKAAVGRPLPRHGNDNDDGSKVQPECDRVGAVWPGRGRGEAAWLDDDGLESGHDRTRFGSGDIFYF
jgi:hypothetical protein